MIKYAWKLRGSTVYHKRHEGPASSVKFLFTRCNCWIGRNAWTVGRSRPKDRTLCQHCKRGGLSP